MKEEKASTQLQLHMIGNAHLDLAWLWPWQEAREEMIHTSQTVLKLMEEYPEFVFTCSQAAAYRWVEEREPELFEKIKKSIREGRWKIVGGWWVQPDVNIPSGESFIRQALYGKLYFREKFGVDVHTGYNVDSFGHTAQLPQILRHTGMKYYVFFRPKPNEKVLPSTLFQWKAPDGSTVLASRPPFLYNSWAKELDSRLRLALDEIDPKIGKEMLFYGVGDHGGGPTRENLNSILRQKKELGSKVQVLFSDPESFFESVAKNSGQQPIVQDELQYHSRGCYSSHSDIKRWNRFLETFLFNAETINSLASLMGVKDYPKETLEEVWKTLLFHQFHDILAGTSISKVYVEAEQELADALFMATETVDSAASALFNAQLQPGGRNILIFNPLAWSRMSSVSARVHIPGEANSLELTDADGHEIPVQIHQHTQHPNEGNIFEISFVDRFPALGAKAYQVKGAEKEIPFEDEKPVQAAETDFYRLKLNPNTGWIEQIFDKENGVNILSGPGNRLVVIHDPYDTWGHDVNAFREEIGVFEPTAPFILEEDGPVFQKIRLESHYGHSVARQSIFLYKKLRRIDFELAIDWEEKFKMLKVAFPLNLHEFHATFEVPFGAIGRPTFGTEEPLQRWMDLSGFIKSEGALEKAYGVALLNDSKYAGDVKLTEMRLTILRSPIFARHQHGIPEDLTGLEFLDQGEQKVRYALLPHGGNWNRAHLAREAESFNNNSQVFWLQNDDLPQTSSFLEISPGNVVTTAFKKKERGPGWILRLYETEGHSTKATVKLKFWNKQFQLELRPFEIKTILLENKKGNPIIQEVNGMEEIAKNSPPLKCAALQE